MFLSSKEKNRPFGSEELLCALIKAWFYENQACFVGLLTCPTTEGAHFGPNMALLTVTPLSIHTHTLSPNTVKELCHILTREGGPSLSLFGVAPHSSMAEANIQSVMELQFT